MGGNAKKNVSLIFLAKKRKKKKLLSNTIVFIKYQSFMAHFLELFSI